MSFNYYARRVRDAGRSPWRRLANLRQCVRSFAFLTGGSYRGLLAYLDLEWTHGVPRDPPTDEFLRRTLDQLERERSWYLQELRVFERRRVVAKSRGNRQLSAAERTLLAEMRGGVG